MTSPVAFSRCCRDSSQYHPSCLRAPSVERTLVFYVTKTAVFGWEYRCVDYFRWTWTSRSDARKCKSTCTRLCTSVVQAARNMWFKKAHSMSTCLALLFCWVNRLPVTAAAEAVGCGRLTIVDHYSMTRKVCEVIMTNEVLDRKFGGDEK